MKTLQVYQFLKNKVKFICEKLNLSQYENTTGRKLKISIPQIITLALYKQTQGIPTKKSIWNDFGRILKCSYKTLVVNMNRRSLLALLILKVILESNRKNSHPIKHTDSTDIPVCLNKNARRHKPMRGLAEWGHSGKGWFYGLKLHLSADHKAMFMKLNAELEGIFVADAGYVSKNLEKEFYQERKRILFAKPRANMKKIITFFQKKLYDTRMIIEINFRNLKMLYNLATSFPRSVNGYLANYVYSMLAYALR